MDCKVLLVLFIVIVLGHQNGHAATTEVACCYSPASVTINVGDSVHWSGLSTEHNVAQTVGSGCSFMGNSGFHSGSTFDAFDSREYTHTFNTSGTFHYGCVHHCVSLNMKGVVIVNANEPAQPSLSSLAAAPATLFPAFSPTILEYSASVPYDITAVFITFTATNSSDVVVGGGAQLLTTGLNTFHVVVAAPNALTATTYTLAITRSESASEDLLSLTHSN